jgi:hypothetical protein
MPTIIFQVKVHGDRQHRHFGKVVGHGVDGGGANGGACTTCVQPVAHQRVRRPGDGRYDPGACADVDHQRAFQAPPSGGFRAPETRAFGQPYRDEMWRRRISDVGMPRGRG